MLSIHFNGRNNNIDETGHKPTLLMDLPHKLYFSYNCNESVILIKVIMEMLDCNNLTSSDAFSLINITKCTFSDFSNYFIIVKYFFPSGREIVLLHHLGNGRLLYIIHKFDFEN